MAGGSGGDSRELDQTPTWAVALVCAVIIAVSLLLEKGLHHLGQWFTKKHKKALFEALEKIKTELMILGFISLLLTFGQNYIAKICIPESAGNVMLPCKLKKVADETQKNRRLLWSEIMDLRSNHRILAVVAATSCPSGKVPLISINGVHQLHIFIFFLAVIHVAYSASTMALGRAKIRSWKDWENETQSTKYEFSTVLCLPSFQILRDSDSLTRHHLCANIRVAGAFLLITNQLNVCFFKQFFRSVRKTDYMTLRHGFINAHLSPGRKFNFQKYVKRSLEDDFKVVVGISPVLWACAVVIMLLNVNGYQELFWASLVPLFVILAVGTKLHAIIARMAVDIQNKNEIIQGIPIVNVSDHHFWFGKPRLVLFLIHFALFVNAFQLSYFFWIWYMFSLKSCFHEGYKFMIARISIGVGIHLLCSYMTLPLYALVSQMGSHIKMSVFDEQISKALKKWRDAARRNHKNGSSHSPSMSPSPQASPLSRKMYNYKTIGRMGGRDTIGRSHSDTNLPDSEIEMFSRRSKPETAEVHLQVQEDHDREEELSFAKFASGSNIQ